jgi:hypothetical protein
VEECALEADHCPEQFLIRGTIEEARLATGSCYDGEWSGHPDLDRAAFLAEVTIEDGACQPTDAAECEPACDAFG